MAIQKQQVKSAITDYLKFIIPSLIGIILFIVPFQYQDTFTIPVAILAGIVQDLLGDSIPYIMTGLIAITGVISIFTVFVKPALITKSPFLSGLFYVSPVWIVTRILGMVFSIMTLFKLGPSAIWSDATGGTLLFDLIPVLFSVFLFAGLFLPLLLDFGLLELFGALLTKVMRPLFRLPGRSSVDAIASWLGDGTVGVLLTNKQYEEGYYTKREAAIIGTTFSVVSITFTVVILAQMGLQNMFVQFYFTILLAGFVAAIITPRIPPLSRKPDTYYEGTTQKADETIPGNVSRFKWGMEQAVIQAKKSEGVSKVVKGGMQNVLDMWMGVVPVVMAIGTIALLIAEYTPIFKYLGAPFVPILALLQVPEAVAASETMVIGFADMFLPTIIGADIENDLTRFVIAGVSITQLIYMSEVGGLLLGSKLPVSFLDLVIIFLQRTLITLPIIVGMAYLFF
ncbi:YjiH family protein [Fredinandcohnia sp. QZ13]|uniref:YjiH family protein n=1 Tax=Fredinandcohnia sp. QZ13 TaxID=3073144 RepID=UPI0028532D06|nr:YjiH family protein [Fredinandcohnia sp. QZ13]MDR4886738.1 YjiH family protein [Fredinandcohnia sp. QZ13]